MTITPQDIQNREFREQFRGYNEDDVDSFLDEVAEEFGRIFMEAQRLRIQLSSIQQEGGLVAPAPAPAMTSEPAPVAPAAPVVRTDERDRAEARGEMKRALVATQRAAEAALEEAKRRGAEIVARAEQRAKEIDDLTARRAKDIDSDASTALTYAQQRVEELRRQEAEIRSRLRRMLAEHIKALQHLEGEGVSSPAQPSDSRRPTAPPAAPRPETSAQTPAGESPKARVPKGDAAARDPGHGPTTIDPPVVEGRRSPVVDRMARDLGEAATHSGKTVPPADDAFWRR